MLEIRDVWPDALLDCGLKLPSLLRFLILSFLGVLYRNSDVVVINAPGFRNMLLSQGCPAGKIRLISNGVNVSDFDEVRDKHSTRSVPPRVKRSKQIRVVYTGAMGIANGLKHLLDVAHRLSSERHITFELYGNGSQKPALLAKAKELNLRNVSIHSTIPKVRVPDLLCSRRIALLFCPSQKLLPRPIQTNFLTI